MASTVYAFRTDVTRSIGLGHLKRLLVLKNNLKIEPFWLINGDKRIVRNFLKGKKIKYINSLNDERKFAKYLADKNIKKVVFDISNNINLQTERHFKIFKIYENYDLKTITFDVPNSRLKSNI